MFCPDALGVAPPSLMPFCCPSGELISMPFVLLEGPLADDRKKSGEEVGTF